MNNFLVIWLVFVFFAVLDRTYAAFSSANNSFVSSDTEDYDENASNLEVDEHAEKCDKDNPSSQCRENSSSSSDEKNYNYYDSSDENNEPTFYVKFFPFGPYKLKNVKNLKKIPKNVYDAEIQAGSTADLFGTNPGNYNPTIFEDFGRRFVPQYSYIEVKDENDAEDIEKLLKQKLKRTLKPKPKKKQRFQIRKKSRKSKPKKNYKASHEYNQNSVIPKKASPEVVLAIAKESKLLEDSKPINPTEELIKKESLRTGEFWDGIWTEEVNPEAVLRAQKKYKKDKTESQEYYKNNLIPKKAPRDLVLAIAKESKLLEDSKPINPTEELINKESLRTGNYWDGVWKEEVNPEPILRSQKKYNKRTLKKNLSPKLETVIANIMPKSKLYHLVSKLKTVSPRLLYIVNNKE